MIRLLVPLLLFLDGPAAWARPLPVPPIPPMAPEWLEAPVPDVDAHDPRQDDIGVNFSLTMGIHGRGAAFTGLGFAPGSHYQSDGSHTRPGVPGFVLRIPFW